MQVQSIRWADKLTRVPFDVYADNDVYLQEQERIFQGPSWHYLCLEAMRTGQLLPVLPEWTPQTKFGTVITATAGSDRMRLGRNEALLAFLREM
mgnify:CR=1 FL=1